MKCRKHNPAELLVLGANPDPKIKPRARVKRNPDTEAGAGAMYEEFHGEAPKHTDEYREPTPRPQTLAEIGDLIELRVERVCGWKWGSLELQGRGIKVADDPSGTQIYFVGGNQRLSKGDLTAMGCDRSKTLIDLGFCRYIAYRTKKMQLDGITATYEHGFGEETHVYPRLLYDNRGPEPRLLLAGGAYHVEARGIIN
jgi:hypothetical protein